MCVCVCLGKGCFKVSSHFVQLTELQVCIWRAVCLCFKVSFHFVQPAEFQPAKTKRDECASDLSQAPPLPCMAKARLQPRTSRELRAPSADRGAPAAHLAPLCDPNPNPRPPPAALTHRSRSAAPSWAQRAGLGWVGSGRFVLFWTSAQPPEVFV